MEKRVALVCALRGGLLLLGTRRDNGKHTLPGGHVEEDETPAEGAARELFEETGLEPKGDLKLIDERETNGTKLYTYRCEVEGVPSGRDDPDQECAVWAWYDVSEGVPKAVAEKLAGPKEPEDNVALDLYGLGKAEQDPHQQAYLAACRTMGEWGLPMDGGCLEASALMHRALRARGEDAQMVRREMGGNRGGHFTVRTPKGEFDPTINHWEGGAGGLHQVGPDSPHHKWEETPIDQQGVYNLTFGDPGDPGHVLLKAEGDAPEMEHPAYTSTGSRPWNRGGPPDFSSGPEWGRFYDYGHVHPQAQVWESGNRIMVHAPNRANGWRTIDPEWDPEWDDDPTANVYHKVYEIHRHPELAAQHLRDAHARAYDPGAAQKLAQHLAYNNQQLNRLRSDPLKRKAAEKELVANDQYLNPEGNPQPRELGLPPLRRSESEVLAKGREFSTPAPMSHPREVPPTPGQNVRTRYDYSHLFPGAHLSERDNGTWIRVPGRPMTRDLPSTPDYDIGFRPPAGGLLTYEDHPLDAIGPQIGGGGAGSFDFPFKEPIGRAGASSRRGPSRRPRWWRHCPIAEDSPLGRALTIYQVHHHPELAAQILPRYHAAQVMDDARRQQIEQHMVYNDAVLSQRPGVKKSEQDLLDEPLGKMAIADIKPGKTRAGLTDYSHLLSPELRAEGYSLAVGTEPDEIRARVYHGDQHIGGVVGFHARHEPDAIEPHSHLLPEHRGLGLGLAAYEALYAHARRRGIKRVRGGDHSEQAAAVHEKLARKHDLDYHRSDDLLEPPQPYEYAIKSEAGEAALAKADVKLPAAPAQFQSQQDVEDFLRAYRPIKSEYIESKAGPDPYPYTWPGDPNDPTGERRRAHQRAYQEGTPEHGVYTAYRARHEAADKDFEDRLEAAMRARSGIPGLGLHALGVRTSATELGERHASDASTIWPVIERHRQMSAPGMLQHPRYASSKSDWGTGVDDTYDYSHFTPPGWDLKLTHRGGRFQAGWIRAHLKPDDGDGYGIEATRNGALRVTSGRGRRIADVPNIQAVRDAITAHVSQDPVKLAQAWKNARVRAEGNEGKTKDLDEHQVFNDAVEQGDPRVRKSETRASPAGYDYSHLLPDDAEGYAITIFPNSERWGKAELQGPNGLESSGEYDGRRGAPYYSWRSDAPARRQDPFYYQYKVDHALKVHFLHPHAEKILQDAHAATKDPAKKAALEAHLVDLDHIRQTGQSHPGVAAQAQEDRAAGVMKSEAMAKNQRIAGFPRLGIEDRRETPYVQTPEQRTHKIAQLTAAFHSIRSDETPNELADYAADTVNRAQGAVFSAPRASPWSGVAGASFVHLDKPDLRPVDPQATKIHEDFHQMMRRIEQRHGREARDRTVARLWYAHQGDREPMQMLSDMQNSGYGETPIRLEEDVATLHDYMNDPALRKKFVENYQLSPEQARHHDVEIKAAFRAAQQRAVQIEPGHVADAMAKMEPEHDEVDRLLLNEDPTERRMALKLKGVQEHHLVRAIGDDDPLVQDLAMAHPAMGSTGLMALMQMPGRERLQLEAVKRPEVGPDHLRALYRTHQDRPLPELSPILRAVSHHPALDASLIDELVHNGHGQLAVENRNADPATLRRLVEEHLDQPTDADRKALARRAVKHPGLDPAVARRAFAEGPNDVKIAVAQGPHMPEDLAQDALQRGMLPSGDGEALLRSFIVKSPKATQKHLQTATRDRNPVVVHHAKQKLGLSKFEADAAAWVGSRLAKATNPKDFESLLQREDFSGDMESAHDPRGAEMVDHTPDLEAYPPEHAADVRAYREHVLKGTKPVHGLNANADEDFNGASPKLLYRLPTNHPTHAAARYLVKLYHEKGARSQRPHQGWAEMTNQALYHAGGIGHLHQKVHVSEHDMGPGHEREPALVVHLAPQHQTWLDTTIDDAKIAPESRESMRQIAMMDFLTDNEDRHSLNIMVHNAPPHAPLAIDHSRSFQYRAEDQRHPNRATQAFLYQLENNRTVDQNDNWQKTLAWWEQASPEVKATFERRLGQIKDTMVRAHLRRNFAERARWLDDASRMGQGDALNTWQHYRVRTYAPGEVTDEEKRNLLVKP